MVYDDIMLASSVDARHITIQPSATSAVNSYKLLSGTSSSSRGYTQVVSLSATDLDAIKKIRTLATSSSDSYISFTGSLATDVAGLLVISVVPTNAKQVRTFTPDSTSPDLSSWSINLATGVATLNFDEVVDVRTFQASAITLQNAASTGAGTLTRTLTGGNTSVTDAAKSFDLTLTAGDLNFLKQNTNFATQTSNSFLTLTSSLVKDMAGNDVNAKSGLQASSHDRDVTNPTLQSTELDLDSGVVTLVFDEVINASSVLTSGLTIQNATSVPAAPSDSLTLTGGTVSTTSSTRITVTLTTADLNALKANTNLGTSTANTFVSLALDAVKDMEENGIVASRTAVQATAVNLDTTAPQLNQFDLDMGASTLKLIFSESVNTATFDFSQINIQSQKGAGGTSVNISGATVTQTSSSRDEITLTLSGAVLDELKKDKLIATTRLNTFISLTASAVQDQSGNDVTPIANTNALDVRSVSADRTKPRLSSFSLDMDGSGQLILTFSETVQGALLNASLVTLENGLTGASAASYTLTGGTTSSGNSPTIVVDLSVADLNALKKSTSLATSQPSTNMIFSQGLVRDAADNVIDALTVSTAASAFTADTTSPTLTSYSVSLLGTSPAVLQLVMTFSEVVNASSLDSSQITLVSTSSTTSATKSVTLGLNTADQSQLSDTVLTVSVRAADLATIRSNRPSLRNDYQQLRHAHSDCSFRHGRTAADGHFFQPGRFTHCRSDSAQANDVQPRHEFEGGSADIQRGCVRDLSQARTGYASKLP